MATTFRSGVESQRTIKEPPFGILGAELRVLWSEATLVLSRGVDGPRRGDPT